MKKTLYDYLGIAAKALPEEIEAAYQAQRARLGNATDHESQNELKLVQQAFTILSDQKQRAKYDQSLDLLISRNNSVIYYSNDAPNGGNHFLTRLIFLVVLAIAGYEVYQQFFQKPQQTGANAQEVSTLSEKSKSPASTVAPEDRVKPVDLVAQTTEPAPQQPAFQQQSAQPDINDVNAVPIPVTATQRRAYVSFLSLPNPRAFVICDDSSVMTLKGNETFVENKLAALPPGCAPYAVNDAVVWKK